MKVLVAVDEDLVLDDVLAALRWCVRVGPGSELTLLHATGLVPWMRDAARSNPAFADMVRTEDEKGARVLAEAARRLATWNLSAEPLVLDDFAAKEILEVARARQVDLIVLGARGREERGFLVGSVSHAIKAAAETDLLVVRRGAPVDRSRFRALLAVDGSPESLRAVDSFVSKTRAEQADVHVVHALELPLDTVWRLFGPGDTDPQVLPAPLRDRATAALTEAMARLEPHRISATTEICRGKAAPEILEAAARHRSDLIVMGARGLSGLRGLFVGSVTERVLKHAASSVLVAR